MSDSIKFWNKQAVRFSESDHKESKELVAMSLQYLKKEDAVLDFACGTGGSTRELSAYVKSVLGIDYSKEMIKFATVISSSPNIRYQATDMNDETLKPGSYDVITAFNVLHLLEDLSSATTRLQSLLKPGGLFISYTACLGYKKTLLSLAIRVISKLNLLPSITAYHPEILEKTLCSHGFEKIEHRTNGKSVLNAYIVLKKIA